MDIDLVIIVLFLCDWLLYFLGTPSFGIKLNNATRGCYFAKMPKPSSQESTKEAASVILMSYGFQKIRFVLSNFDVLVGVVLM